MKHGFRAGLFEHVVDAHGAADALEAAIKTDPRGRRRRSNPRTFLILMLLAAADGQTTVEHMHDIAIHGLPREVQLRLGILRSIDGRAQEMPIDELYYLSRTITAKLSTSGRHAEALDQPEAERRRLALQDIVDRLVLGTLPDRPGSSYALDESALWAWAKGRKSRRNTPAAEAAGARDGESASPAPLSACPDATWGTKTGKDGQQDAYFGYALHALVRVPDMKSGPRFDDYDDPVLIEAIAITPASTDVVEVSLELIDRVRSRRPVVDLLADRHYSYKEWSRWAHHLWLRGVRPVVDLREDEHGFRPHDGTRLAASWPHCPGTPTRLAELPRPGTGAAARVREAFDAAISERQAYAMRRVKSHVPDGVSRWECPARAGKVGCPHVAGTVQVAHDLGMPIVARPPAGNDLPDCCTQRTFMIRTQVPQEDDDARTRRSRLQLGQTMKHAQDEYWGSHRWITSWNRRTYVEGAFGNLKNPSTENVSRGIFRFTGLPLVSLAIAASVAASNTRQFRNWHHRTSNGDPDHPLLQLEPAFHGFSLITSPADPDTHEPEAA